MGASSLQTWAWSHTLNKTVCLFVQVCVCVYMWVRMPKALYPFFICCVFPFTVNFDRITSPKSRHFARVSNPLYTNTEKTPQPFPDRQGDRGELFLSLMFGRRRRAWCRRQAVHWWRLAPPYEGLYHQYYYFFFFFFPPSTSPELPACFLTSADFDEFQLVSVCSFSFEVLFILVSHFVSQAFSHRQRDLFLIQAPVFLS